MADSRVVQVQGQASDKPVRIVSLVPSLTELLFELGCASQIVGRTGYCIHPKAAVAAIAKVGGTKTVNIEKIRKLEPTHLIVNIDENEKPTVDQLREFVPQIVVTHPIQVADNLVLYKSFGEIFDCEAKAQALAARLGAQLDANAAQQWAPRKVVYLIWKDPWMTVSADTYVARMLAQVGLMVVPVAHSTARYPTFDWGQLDLSDCDALLLSSEPYQFNEQHCQLLQSMPQLAHCAVRLIDGEMTSWYGSRAVLGLEYLRAFRRALE